MTEGEIKPIIVTSVTLGKELHAGHILLLATADLLRTGLGSQEAITLVNNNTGPRAAGALISMAEQAELPIEDTARLLSKGLIIPEAIVDAYRGRVEFEVLVAETLSFLDEGRYDIFKIMADNMTNKLSRAGFRVNIIPESGNLMDNQEVVEEVNPLWSSTGFMFSGEKGVRVLERAGQLTASGKCLVSLASLARRVIASGEVPLTIFVDSAPDTADAITSFATLDLGKAMQLQGAAIGFEGSVASGSKGEAKTLSELLETFEGRLSLTTLKMALRYFILSRPVNVPFIKTPNLGDSFYDFKDNQSLLNAIESCYGESVQFEANMRALIMELKSKVGEITFGSDDKLNRALSFLPLRTKSILETEPEKIVSSMKSAGWILKDRDEIINAVAKQGYEGQEAENKVRQYLMGSEGLVIRDNFYQGTLKSIIRVKDQIESLTEEDFRLYETTIDFCLERLGFNE